MARSPQMSRRNLVILGLAAGVLVAAVLLLAVWPRGPCDLSPCSLNQSGPGKPCILVRIIGPCPVTAYSIAVPLVAGFAAAAVAVIARIWLRRRHDPSSI